MHIDNFEQHIDATIVDRGFEYFEDHLVEEVEQVDQGEFSAIVCGNEDYEVYIRLDQDANIIEKDCNCPYDWGDTCKHEVALLFHIREHSLHKQTLSSIQLRIMLDELSEEELRDFVFVALKKNHALREDFISKFG